MPSNRHELEIEWQFGYAPTVKLICPDDGSCKPVSFCEDCGANDQDEDSWPCEHIPEPAPCWARTWADADGLSEFLMGKVKIPVDVLWEDDAPRLEVVEDEDGV